MIEGTDMIENVARTAAWLRECHDWLLANGLDGGCPMTVQPEPVAWKNYAEDGDWWLTDDREPADICAQEKDTNA